MAQKISQMTEQTTSSMTEAGTSDFLGGYTTTGGNANRKFSLSGLANYFLNKFKMTLGGSSQTVKSAIDALNSNKYELSKGTLLGNENDLDTIRTVGSYEIYRLTSIPAHAPENSRGRLYVYDGMLSNDANGDAICQEYITYPISITYVRYYKASTTSWSSWEKQPTRAEVDALNSKTLVTFTPETGVRVVENNLVRVGNVVVGNLWLEVTASEKTAKSSTLGSFSQYSLLAFRVNANIVDTTKTARGSFKVTYNSNVLEVDNNYALPELGAYNITFCFCTKD